MEIRVDLLNAIYLGVVEECERREAAGELQCNGHHMAQEIVNYVQELLSRNRVLDEILVLNAVMKATYSECYPQEKGDYNSILIRSNEMARRATDNVRKQLAGKNLFEPHSSSFWRNLFRR